MSENLVTIDIVLNHQHLPEWIDPDDAEEFARRVEEEANFFTEKVLALQREFEKITRKKNDGCVVLKFGGPS